ncbi:MAG: galactosyldiacylglycerol synthase [Firmicutes bacterium HGW-Firmicutes-12]|jgi:processive 1,2-diacylglycerol beta-glucosyltransferase|nr:MAG: galactosyldiacylglycerol synthase [Firmicutes bacterium HGW-Firmicutes-12]
MIKPVKPIRALIFSVSIGSGHDNVAKAMAERLLEEIPGSEAEIIDTFQYINATLHKVMLGSYMETLKFTPKVWGYLYNQVVEGERFIDIGQLFSKVLSPRLDQLLKQFNPDIIITTHAFPTGILSIMKERGQINIPVASVITDFHVHSLWIHHGVDRYFIPEPDLSNRLLHHGIKAKQIIAVGIPIRTQFSKEINSEQAKSNLGLSVNTPTILVMGGGLGLGRIEKIVEEILEDSIFEVMVVTGKNKILQENLADLKNTRLKVFGFIENMAEVIAASDIVISKPGGVTTAEVLAMRKPLVIFSALPGQEDCNTEYLLNKGAALKVQRLDMLLPEINSFWSNPLKRRHMKEMAEQLGVPNSSKMAWEELWDLLAK